MQAKPCPFCGVVPTKVRDLSLVPIKYNKFVTGCDNKRCPVKPKVASTSTSIGGAVRKWNTRHEPKEKTT